MDKHKEQLKMLFFNPGKNFGYSFIGDKLIFTMKPHKLYEYKLMW